MKQLSYISGLKAIKVNLCSLVFCSISRSFSVDIIKLSLKASTLRFKAVKSGIAVSVNEIVFWQVLESKSSESPILHHEFHSAELEEG